MLLIISFDEACLNTHATFKGRDIDWFDTDVLNETACVVVWKYLGRRMKR